MSLPFDMDQDNYAAREAPAVNDSLALVNDAASQAPTPQTDHEILTDWQDRPGQMTDEGKEIVRQALSRCTGYAFSWDFITLVTSYLSFFGTRDFHACAMWVLLDNHDLAADVRLRTKVNKFQLEASERHTKFCPNCNKVNPRPYGHGINMLKLLDKVFEDQTEKLRAAVSDLEETALETTAERENARCVFECQTRKLRAAVSELKEDPLKMTVERENARRAIEWHSRYNVWQAGWIFYDDELVCEICGQIDSDASEE
ncbi:hypothetical protein IWX49DRAFT_624976 [Phyllosticta citricarpa]|uniref:Uncharacterized protein n=2 Tax=Phyllosticta TaxID=121621 RepID=A0ABR1MIA3_9PEZI